MTTLYVPAPRKVKMVHDGDYLYNYKLLRLSDYSSQLTVARASSITFDLRTYSRLAFAYLRRRQKLPIPLCLCWHLSQFFMLDPGDPGLSRANVVLAYERYPKNSPLPVVWITGPVEIEKLRKRGWSQRQIQREINFKRCVNKQAAITVLTTRSKKALFDAVVEPTRPTCVVPFFQAIEPVGDEALMRKWSNTQPLKLLFIGRAARRKGLALVLEAFKDINERYPGLATLQIVTSFSDGIVEIPKLPGVTHTLQVTQDEALKLMREAHYLVMPSELESYGWVYVEAMAQGAIPVASDSPVQRELLGGGDYGFLVQRTAHSILEAVAVGIETPEVAASIACRGLAAWKRRYAPSVVAADYARLALAALEHGTSRAV